MKLGLEMASLLERVRASYRSLAVLNFDRTREILAEWNRRVPYVAPYYAVKAFPHPDFVKFLGDCGLGFDVASQSEIQLVKQVAPQADLVFSNPTKSAADIQYAQQQGLGLLVVDSVEETAKVHREFPTARLLVRLMADDSSAKFKFNVKFGADAASVASILEYVARHKLLFEGLAFHVGSESQDMQCFGRTLRSLFSLCDEVGLSLDQVRLIDIGGGLLWPSQLQELDSELEPFKERIEKHQIRLIAEPGRLLCGKALDLYTKVVAVRKRVVDGKTKYLVTINDGVFHSLICVQYDEFYEVVPLYTADEEVDVVLFGQTCDATDTVAELRLPKPQEGDVLLFKEMGAYSLSISGGQFNGFEGAVVTT